MFEEYADYWKPRLDTGHTCMRYMLRNIFTPQQRADYEKDGKTPVEPQEMKKVINALAKQIKQAVQGSTVTMEDDIPHPSAAKPEVVSVVLKSNENDLGGNRLKDKVLRDGLITGFPQWIWYDFEIIIDDIVKQVANHPAWNSILPSPYFESPEGKDIHDVIRIAWKTKAELLDIYPDRKDAIKEFDDLNRDPGLYNQRFMFENTETSEERNQLLKKVLDKVEPEGVNGYYLVIERVFPVKHKRKLYVNESVGDVVTMPQDWPRSRKRQWEIANPDYQLIVREELKTLWTTTVTSNGFVWENEQHWFQNNGKLPGSVYIPDIIDGVPVGVGEDQLPYILSIAAAETEGLHQVRTGTGEMTWALEGAIKDPYSVGEEMSKSHGVGIINKKAAPGGRIDQVVKTFQRKPNETFFNFADRLREQAKMAHSVNDSIIGASHPRQSDVSKQTEIVQGMTPQAPYVDNYSSFDLNDTQLRLELIPYVYNEEKIIRINDDYALNQKEVSVNIQQFDYKGQAKIIANDLTVAKYVMIPTPAEDTATSRERELQQFADIIRSVGNQLFKLDPRIMAYILSGLPNRYSRQTGSYLMQIAGRQEQAQAQAAQAEQQKEMLIEKGRRDVDKMKISTPDVSFKLSPQDIQEAPMAAQIMFSAMNAFNQQAALQSQPGVQQ
jgi:inosine/xanthosine triphosphate pyrophosphatase family protein